uniref:Protein O-mannosyltransferase 1 n=1 Tax=Cacopsylla melanoneura TaxID=428564 RepID=A0A8D8M8C3_9HEMI
MESNKNKSTPRTTTRNRKTRSSSNDVSGANTSSIQNGVARKLVEEEDESLTSEPQTNGHGSSTSKESHPYPSLLEDILLTEDEEDSKKILFKKIRISFEFDIVIAALTLAAFVTRFYKLDQPHHVVFDEIHFGKHINMYIKNTFYYDAHPPLGNQLVSAVSYLAGYKGDFKFDHIGQAYKSLVPLVAMRLIPALCGTLLVPLTYSLMIELKYKQKTAAIAAFLILTDTALLTQSRFILMESMLLCFSLFGLLCVIKFSKHSTRLVSIGWWAWLTLGSISLTLAVCIKYAGLYSWYLASYIIWSDYWTRILGNRFISDRLALGHALARGIVCTVVPVTVYLAVFYAHFHILHKAGPHDTVMTSAFQASLEGGLASITKGQPLEIVHGSQVTLRYTTGKPCWLHSHAHMYPILYQDKRGSSHQQQVTCYTFKDVNNWWIVKHPDRNSITVDSPPSPIRHGDVIQLIHGMTLRALNSHDVGAPMSPQHQEVSCYVDYNISMPAQNLWRVEILNRDSVGDVWHTIRSVVRLVHTNSSQALKFSGKHLPDWGFHQYEVVTSKELNHDTVQWNVEEHRYTKQEYEDDKDRERDLVNAEMIPIKSIRLSFWSKFIELQYKMLLHESSGVSNHMYSSEPIEWPTLTRGIAYWISAEHNGQVHLLGNLVTWYSGLVSLVLYPTLLTFYLLRRRRLCYDISQSEWSQFCRSGEVFFVAYCLHYLPYYFLERTLFLHHYLTALVFKILLTASLVQHLDYLVQTKLRIRLIHFLYNLLVFVWIASILFTYKKFSVLSYGTTPLSAVDIVRLKWKDSWDFIVHKQ